VRRPAKASAPTFDGRASFRARPFPKYIYRKYSQNEGDSGVWCEIRREPGLTLKLTSTIASSFIINLLRQGREGRR
jgi:hypothetical protein